MAKSCRKFYALPWSDRLRWIQRQSDGRHFRHSRRELRNVYRPQRHRAKRPGRRPHGSLRGCCGNAPSGKSRASTLRDGVCGFLHRAFCHEPHHRLRGRMLTHAPSGCSSRRCRTGKPSDRQQSQTFRGRECADTDLTHGHGRQQCTACHENPLRLRRRRQGCAHSGE